MTAPITPDERADLRARYAFATTGLWGYYGPANDDGRCYITRDHDVIAADVRKGDAEFIAAARTAVPRLLDALDTAEAEIARLRTAPVWDEDTVTEAVARRLHADACSEYDYAWEPNANTFRNQARGLLAVVREHLPVFAANIDGLAFAIFEHSHEPSLPDDQGGMEEARSRALDYIQTYVEHAPVRPDRETVAQAIFEAGAAGAAVEFGLDGPVPWSSLDADDVERMCAQADAALALWPGESRATVQAEALRDAADDRFPRYDIDVWLRARADRLDPRGADRG